MCVAIVLALILLPLAGWAIGSATGGASGAWIGAAAGLALAVLLGAVPTAIFLGVEKKQYDERNGGGES